MTCLSLFKLFQKLFGSLSSTNPTQANFCHFPSNLLQGFCLLRPVRPFYPSFFSYFHFFSCILGRNLNLWKFGVFIVFNLFFQNWSMVFCCGMILIWSLWFNLIKLMNWEKLDFLGLETTRIGDCVQLSINWWNWLV